MAKRKSGYSNNEAGFVVSDDDQNGSAAPSSKRSKKTAETVSSHFSTPSATTPAQRDSNNDLYWEISKARRVVLSDFKGKRMISVREYYEKDGSWMPGKKGISMTLEQYGALVGFLPAIENELRRSGVEDVPRPDYGAVNASKAVKDEVDDETEDEDEEEAEDNSRGGRANHEATSDEEE